MNVDINLYDKRVPIVYTTRLEDMIILKKELSKMKFEDTIKIITDESKPCYKNISNASVRSKKNVFFQKLKLKRNANNTKIVQQIPVYNTDKNKRHSIETQKCNSNLLKNASKNKTNEWKLKNLLALCKPLRVVLEDVRKKIAKRVHDKDKVIYVLSSDDEDKNIEPENVNSFYIITNTDEYKDFIIKKDLRNSLIIFHNKYLDELDTYEIDDTCIVVECLSAKSGRIYRFRTKKRNSVFNIVVCCWKKRQYYITLLEAVDSYRNIAKFMYTRHSCQFSCVCCCLKENTNCNDNKFTFLKTDGLNNQLIKGKTNTLLNYKHKSDDNLHSSSNHASALILSALVYKKHSKWKGNQEKVNSTKMLNKLECHTLIKLSNTDGISEIYELGRGDQIFSKLVINSQNDSSWLMDTLGTPRKLISKIHGPMERESQISLIKNGMNISVANYLRMPKPKDNIICNKQNLQINKGILDIYSYIIEYTRCLTGAKNKQRPVIAILPKEYITEIPADNQKIGQDLPLAAVTNVKKKLTPDQVDNQKGQNIASASIDDTKKDVSQCINSLIKNILYRFRDINLTINSEGKVSASLNAPLSSLSSSELKILSGILIRAQSQVDELGLTKRKLNEDTKKLLQSNFSNNQFDNAKKQYLLNPIPTNIFIDTIGSRKRKITSDSPTFDSTKNSCNPSTVKSPDAPYINASSEDVSKFSMWVSNKKKWYVKTFKTFLSDAVELHPPKIVDVFSLQTDVNPNSRKFVIPEDMEVDKSNETDITDIKTEIADEFTKAGHNCVNDIQQQM